MAQDSIATEFEGSIDFMGRPSLSRATSCFDFYGSGSMQIPSSFYSPAPTTYSSTDDCMTPDHNVSEYDFETAYQQNLKSVQRRNYYAQQEKCLARYPPSVDRIRPTSAYPGHDQMNYSPTRSMIEAPPTPASSTEAPSSGNSKSRQGSSSKSTNEDSQQSAKTEKTKPQPDSKSKPQKKRKPPTVSKGEKPKVPKLDRPLSELTQGMVDYPIRDMETWVRRSIEDRRREVAKRDGHVARPMNSFMLYRSAFAERTKMWCLQNNHQVVSSVSGASWPLEPPYIREKYNELARIERINHQMAHPGYKFSPSKTQPPPPRRRKSSVDADCESVYSTDVSDFEDPNPAPLLSKPPPAKKRARTKPAETKEPKKQIPRGDPVSTEATPSQPTISFESHMQHPNATMHPSLRLQTGAQKSSYEALNPGRSSPVSMGATDMNGSYYQTIVRPTATKPIGNSMIEDVTIRKTAAPISTSRFMETDVKAPEEGLEQNPGQIDQYRQQQQCHGKLAQSQEPHQQYHHLHAYDQFQGLLQEPVAMRPGSVPMDQSFYPYPPHNPSPVVDVDHYRYMLHQQLMQNNAAIQSGYLQHQVELTAPYPFVSPGIDFSSSSQQQQQLQLQQSPAGYNEENMPAVVFCRNDALGMTLWPGMDEGGMIHTDPQTGFKYDEWLAEN